MWGEFCNTFSPNAELSELEQLKKENEELKEENKRLRDLYNNAMSFNIRPLQKENEELKELLNNEALLDLQLYKVRRKNNERK